MNAKEAVRMLGGSVTIYVIMAACSGGGSAPPLAGDDGGGGSGSGASSGATGDGSGGLLDALTDPVPAANADPTQSGTRLKVQYYAGADGSKQAAGMFDSQLNTRCYFGKASDGKTRCLPVPDPSAVTIATQYYFSDAACSQPLGVTIGACGPTPTLITKTVTDNSTCATTTTSYHAGTQFTGPLYQLSSSTCTAVGAAYQATLVSDGFMFYTLGAQVQPPDPSQYVEATMQTEP